MFGRDKNKPLEVKCMHCKKKMRPEQIEGFLVQQGSFVVFACPNCEVILHIQAKENNIK